MSKIVLGHAPIAKDCTTFISFYFLGGLGLTQKGVRVCTHVSEKPRKT